jgi:hypothetical protein
LFILKVAAPLNGGGTTVDEGLVVPNGVVVVGMMEGRFVVLVPGVVRVVRVVPVPELVRVVAVPLVLLSALLVTFGLARTVNTPVSAKTLFTSPGSVALRVYPPRTGITGKVIIF